LDFLIPNITPKGLLEVEKIAQKTPEVKVSPPASENLFLREGDSWTLKFGSDQPIRLKDSVGLVYIHHLIQHPGRELLAMVLVQQTRGAAAVGRTATAAETRDADLSDDDTSGTGALLDPQAKRDYRKRIEDLEEDIEEAERNNNLAAAANAREELQFLKSQLSEAFGLGGQPRPVGSPAENARKSVSEAIRRALKNIRSMDSHLGNHLTNSIKTGVYVYYSPESAVDWHL
jgi:non-specific serine/threonine protein kinase